MSRRQDCLRSLGGGALAGERIVRIVYMDEAGISQVSQEPHLVVAAAITEPDRQWHDIMRHYQELAEDFFDEEFGAAFVFHAKDIFHGAPPYSREKYSFNERLNLLKRLAQVPRKFGIPICLGIIKKEAFNNQHQNTTPKSRRVLSYAMTFHLAMQSVDWWMETNCPGEVAMIVSEDTPEVKGAIHLFQQSAQSDAALNDHEDPDAFQTRCIVDAVNFAPKDRSPILQLADTCAFIARRRLRGCKFANKILAEFWPQVVIPRTSKRQVVLKFSIEELNRIAAKVD